MLQPLLMFAPFLLFLLSLSGELEANYRVSERDLTNERRRRTPNRKVYPSTLNYSRHESTPTDYQEKTEVLVFRDTIRWP